MKGWFSMNKAFRQLLHDWPLLAVAGIAMSELLGGAAQAELRHLLLFDVVDSAQQYYWLLRQCPLLGRLQ